MSPLDTLALSLLFAAQGITPIAGDTVTKQERRETSERESRVTPVVQVVRKVGPAVVHIRTEVPVQQRGIFGFGMPQIGVSMGSGVVVDPDGYLVTNEHVIHGARKIDVFLAGDDGSHPYSGEVVNADPEHDLALVKISRSEAFPSVVIGRSDDLMIGETVIAIGNPTGMLADSVTTGVLSAKNREMEINGRTFRGLLQTDAAINPGNSGGPLLNLNGELIGINFSILLTSGQSFGFAIPADQVRAALDERLLNVDRTQRFWLGMRVDEADEGVRVKQVDPGGPAAKAGVREGDVIVSLGGKPVRKVLEYAKALLPSSDGEELRLRVRHGAAERDVALRLLGYDDRVLWERLGVLVREVPVRVGRRNEMRLVVETLDAKGPAAEIKLEPKDVLWAFRMQAPSASPFFRDAQETREYAIDSKERLRRVVEQIAVSRGAKELTLIVQRDGRGYEGEIAIR